MRKYVCVIIVTIICCTSSAQQHKFSVSLIPEALKKNTHSVKREERIEFNVKAIDRASYTVHRVITILDEGGKEELEFVQYADKFHSLEDASIHVLDANGVTIKKYDRSDLSRIANTSDLVPNGKFYYMTIPVSSYPVTIQMDYEIKYNGILNYPDYNVQFPEQSIESSSFTAKVPLTLDLRFKELNINLTANITTDDKYKTYSWSVKNLPAVNYEEGGAARASRYPKILLSPNKFELDGYEGDISTWKNFGYWYGNLSKDAGKLTAEKKEFFKSLVKDAVDDKEKAKILYTYLQDNFRYVSIQLGIGGFKPFEADFVDKKKYGDCKALSNYMQASLAAVGIKSHQALINAYYNAEPVDPLFPYNGFNHCILCVPMGKDSIWLECTSATNEFGVLGSFTENRNALLITEDGGKLVPTPRSKAEENVFAVKTTVLLKDDASGTAISNIITTGEYKQDFLNYIADQKKDEQKKYIVQRIGYIQPDQFTITYDKINRQAPTILQLDIEKIPDFTAGNKFFLNPRIYKIWGYSLPKAENRTQDYYFEHPFTKIDTTIYQLPQGFIVETLPKAKNLQYEYGSFTASYQYNEALQQVTILAKLVLNEFKIPAPRFTATKKFFNDVMSEYQEKIVIRKKS